MAGCSTTYGIGVELTERYANIVADALNLPLSLLACSGASNTWAADQILRSNVNPGDTVIMGLTTYGRAPIIHNNQLIHLAPNTFTILSNLPSDVTPDYLLSDTRLYESLTSIKQVNNFCSKAGARLLLIGIHANIEISAVLANDPNYIMFHGKYGTNFNDGWLDFGNDNLHPGPKTHQMYANLILEKLKELES